MNFYRVTDGPDVTSGDTTKANASVSASASRAQTTVVVNNIMARTVSVHGAGAPAPQGTPTPGESSGTTPPGIPGSGDAENTFQTSDSQYRNMTFRELAMNASFNSAHLMTMSADTDISGIEQRRSLTSTAPFTIWGQGSYTSAENSFNKAGDDRRYDGDTWGYNVGGDYRITENLVGGLSVGYSETDIDTEYNTGSYEESTWSINPYVMYQPIDNALFSLIGGYSFGDAEIKRNSSTISGDTDTTSWLLAASGEYSIEPSDQYPLRLTTKLGYTLSRKDTDAYTESDGTNVDEMSVDTNQIKPGLELAYSLVGGTTTFIPFIKSDFVYDFVDPINDDKSALNLGIGLRIVGANGLSCSFEGESMLGRTDYTEYTLRGLVAYNFDIGDKGAELGTLAPYMRSDFSAENGQSFGTGMKFTAPDASWNCALDTNYATNAAATDNIDTKLSIEWLY